MIGKNPTLKKYTDMVDGLGEGDVPKMTWAVNGRPLTGGAMPMAVGGTHTGVVDAALLGVHGLIVVRLDGVDLAHGKIFLC